MKARIIYSEESVDVSTVEMRAEVRCAAGVRVSRQELHSARFDIREGVNYELREELGRVIYGDVRSIARHLRRAIAELAREVPMGYPVDPGPALALLDKLMTAAQVEDAEPPGPGEGEGG